MSARTILNPPLINELNGLFNGTTPIDVSEVTLQNGANSVTLTASSTADNVLNVAGSVITTNLEVSSPAGYANLSISDNVAGNPLVVSTSGGGGLYVNGAGVFSNGLTVDGAVTLIGGANSVTLTASSSADNTLVVPGDMTVGNSITLPTNASAFISSPTFSGGVASALFTPPTPGAWDCGPGTVTQIVLPPFYFNPAAGVLNCPYFFTIQTSNNVTVSVANYSLAQVNFEVTITIQVANLQAAGGAVVSISVLTFNPSV